MQQSRGFSMLQELAQPDYSRAHVDGLAKAGLPSAVGLHVEGCAIQLHRLAKDLYGQGARAHGRRDESARPRMRCVAGRPLRILQASTADIRGGAERVAWDLFTTYRSRGHCSWLCVGQKRTADADVFVIPNRASYGRWYRSC